MTRFSDSYVSLNAEQRLAVDTIEGPVMVVAGPGTGKTQVLAVRVANILKRTQARPSNVLCLTFSHAGATAMRERLRDLIGSDAYAVTVDTIHGFCDAIIRRNAPVFESRSLERAASDLEKYRIMCSIADELASTSSLIHPKNPYVRIPDLLARISECKREGTSLEDLLRVADIFDAAQAAKSTPGTKAHERNLLQAKKFRDVIEVYRRYTSELSARGLYDFDDMILSVDRALSEEEWLKATLQERYQYILVDEAQDLSGSQWKIISHLTTYDTLPHEPNFFLVGDDDQSIYRFQGANMEHLLKFRERFPGAPVIVLTTSYRSTQPILDAASRLIEKSPERLIGRMPGLTKDLRSVCGTEVGEPLLLRPPSDTAEPWLIADLIEERIARGIAPEEMAVLVVTNAELVPMYDVLRSRGIPAIMQGKADLLQHPLILQVLAMLRCVASGTSDALLHALACDCFGCHPADIARLIHASRATKKSALELLLSDDLSVLTLADAPAIVRARDILLDLRQAAESRSLLDTVERLITSSSLTRSSDGSVVDPLQLAAVEAFFQHVKKRCLEHPFLTLYHFMADLAPYADPSINHLRISYHVPHLVTSGVALLTAHQSKGLEFHTVILSNFREGHWDDRTRPSGVAVPEELLYGWEPEAKRREQHSDERRLAYVAMTRAKRELIFLCPSDITVGEKTRPVSPSAFFAEAGPLPEKAVSLKDPENASLLLMKPVRTIDRELSSYIAQRLENFALSPSALTAFLSDPQVFLMTTLLSQPERFDESSQRSLSYGSAIHWALRQWATDRQKGRERDVSSMLSDVEWYLRERCAMTQQQYDDLVAHARIDFPVYCEKRLKGATPFIYAVEREYRARLGDLSIKGKIDRIDLASETSSDALVIDFKTGSPKAPRDIRGGVEEGKVSWTAAGANFRQLVFYALLIEHAEPLLTPQAYRLEFIGERGVEPISRDFVVTEREKDDLRLLITAVWQKLLAQDFSPLA